MYQHQDFIYCIMVGKRVKGETNIGPLLAFGAFEEETFLVFSPLANAQAADYFFCRTKIAILRLLKKESQSSTAALPANSSGERGQNYHTAIEKSNQGDWH